MKYAAKLIRAAINRKSFRVRDINERKNALNKRIAEIIAAREVLERTKELTALAAEISRLDKDILIKLSEIENLKKILKNV